MASKLRLSSLIPAGLVVESIAESEGTISEALEYFDDIRSKCIDSYDLYVFAR